MGSLYATQQAFECSRVYEKLQTQQEVERMGRRLGILEKSTGNGFKGWSIGTEFSPECKPVKAGERWGVDWR
jgi:hypothetical protein